MSVLSENAQALLQKLERSIDSGALESAKTQLKQLKESLDAPQPDFNLPPVDAIFQELPWALLVHDGTQILFANEAALHLLGNRTLGEINCKPVWQYILPDQENKWKVRLRWVDMSTGPMPWRESYVYPAPGVEYKVDGLTQKLDASDSAHYMEVLHPYDWDKKWKRWSSETEQRFARLFESSPLAISMNNMEGEYLEVNDAFVSMFGYSEDELLQMNFGDITHPDDLEVDRDLTQQLFLGEIGYFQMRKRFFHKDGTEVWGHLTATLIKNEHGVPLYGIGMIENVTGRIEVEENLRRNEKYLANILNSPTNLIVYSLDSDYCYMAFNENHRKEIQAVYGKAIAEGDSFLDLHTDPDERQRLQVILDRVLRGEETTIMEEGKNSLGPNRKVYEEVYHPIRSASGEIEGITVFVQDITASRKNEMLVAESQQMLQSINENIREGIYRSLPDKGLVYANPAFVQMFGYDSIEDLLQSRTTNLYANPEERQRWVERLLKDKKVNNEEARFQRKDGTPFWGLFTCTLHETKDGKIVIDGAIRDITQQKETESTIRETELMLGHISRNINEAIYRSSKEGGLRYINETFVEMFGYDSKAEVMELDPGMLYYDPSDRENLGNLLRAEKELSNIEIRFRKKDGSFFWGLLSSIETNSPKGVFFDGAIRDITIQKDIQHELKNAKELAEQMNQLKTEFLANMSHEIRTPINGIIGLAEIMEDEFRDNELLGNYTSMLKQSGRRLLNTITSILDLSKMESERLDVQLSDVKVSGVLEEMLPTLKVLSDRKGLLLEWHNEAAGAIVQIDRQVLEQIFNNLIGNAIKFTQKGSVSILTKVAEQQEECLWQCTVTDTGVGISEEFLPHLFSSFQQESKGINRKFEGTGLGLAIVKRYLEMYGGTIHVESKKGKGSSFEIRLPLANVEDL